jgi:FkbM family methyltransferase
MEKFKILDHTFMSLDKKKKLTILDFGSNKGGFYRSAVKIFGDDIDKYIGVEPNITLYNKYLKSLNNDKSIFYNNAISPVNNIEINFFEFESAIECGNTIGGEFLNWGGKLNEYKIKTINLDHIIKTNYITEIDFLKIDIEGSEYLLIDAFDNNSLSTVKQLSIEFHDFVDPSLRDKTKQSIEIIKSLGFDLVHSESLNYKHNTDYIDCLFINKNI